MLDLLEVQVWAWLGILSASPGDYPEDTDRWSCGIVAISTTEKRKALVEVIERGVAQYIDFGIKRTAAEERSK